MGDKVKIKACLPGDDPADVCLDLPEMARFLFGPFPPDLPSPLRHQPVLRRAFPLPVHWHPLAHV
jgi:hypothetical protein